jgi:hypothetical protein
MQETHGNKHRFLYKTNDDARMQLVKQINDKLNVLDDQEAYLRRRVPFNVWLEGNYIKIECTSFHVRPLQLQLLSLPPAPYTWASIAELFLSLSPTVKTELLTSISKQVNDRVTELGSMQSAVSDMEAEFNRLTPDWKSNSSVPVDLTKVRYYSHFSVKLMTTIKNGAPALECTDYTHYARAVVHFLRTF